jgi:hypothetical protein
MHHDKDFAVERNGLKNIFINTPNNAAWFERYITDWTGPKGRIGRIIFQMKASVYPGDTMVLSGQVKQVPPMMWVAPGPISIWPCRSMARWPPVARPASPSRRTKTTTPGRARAISGSPEMGNRIESFNRS